MMEHKSCCLLRYSRILYSGNPEKKYCSTNYNHHLQEDDNRLGQLQFQNYEQLLHTRQFSHFYYLKINLETFLFHLKLCNIFHKVIFPSIKWIPHLTKHFITQLFPFLVGTLLETSPLDGIKNDLIGGIGCFNGTEVLLKYLRIFLCLKSKFWHRLFWFRC